MDDESATDNYWLSRNLKGEALSMLDETPIEGTYQSESDSSVVILITRNGDGFDCFKKHWAMETPTEVEEPVFLRGYESAETWEPIGTIERISKEDYEHYNAFRLFG